jgi:hypothetical protein
VPSRRLRAAAVLAALATGAAATAAAAHPARDERPGAPQLDVEVLVPPSLDDQLTPGATDADVSLDRFGNRFAVAVKETAAAPDPRSSRLVRTASWRWVSLDRGDSWDNLDLLPLRADLLVPPARSVAVASEGARTVLVEDHGGLVRVQPVEATGLGRFTPAVPGVVVTGTSRPVDVAVRGASVVLLAGHPTGGHALYRSTDGGSTFSTGTPVSGEGCAVATDLRPGSRTVVVVCHENDVLVAHVSADDGATLTRRTIGTADRRTADRQPAVDVGPDGRLLVLSGMRLHVSRDAGRSWRVQDLQVEPGEYRSVSLAVSRLGRVALAAYRRARPGEPWTVVTTVFSPGRRPVLSDFASHDPVAPAGAADPPSTRTAVAFGPDARMQLLWSSTYLHAEDIDRPLVRNVWSIRANST